MTTAQSAHHALPGDGASKAVLVVARLVAAGIIIPVLSQGLTVGAANRGARDR